MLDERMTSKLAEEDNHDHTILAIIKKAAAAAVTMIFA